MAIGDPYATAAQLAARLGTADDGTYSGLLLAASQHVNAFTGRQFNMTTTASARRFRALDCERVRVDDFHTTTDLAVIVDGTAWDIADVDPRPWDGVVNGEPGWPYFDLFAIDRYWPLTRFRRATIEVTAQWGWAAVPDAIVEATLDVAQVMSYGASGSATSLVAREQIGDTSESFFQVPAFSTSRDIPQVLAKAAPYRRKRFGVA